MGIDPTITEKPRLYRQELKSHSDMFRPELYITKIITYFIILSQIETIVLISDVSNTTHK